jgi:hypothetical protein
MFDADERARLRAQLLEKAAADARVSGAALTGSAAAGREDRWSDVDVAFGVAAAVDPVLHDFTAWMYAHGDAIHHVDVHAGAWIYRVFLRRDGLQVDLAFVPDREFRPLAPTFRLVSGRAGEALPPLPAQTEPLIGMAWLYALHARSALARGRLWQAEYMIGGVRDHALALACLRHHLPAVHARGLDDLPEAVTAPFAASLVGRLDRDDMAQAFQSAMECLVDEIRAADAALAARLGETLLRMPAELW